MNSVQQGVEVRPSGHQWTFAADKPASDQGSPGVVWVTHSSMNLAIDVVSKLRALNLDAKLWDESHAAGQGRSTCDIVVADPAGLRMIARSVSRSAVRDDLGEPQPWRGGLSPGVLRRVLTEIEGKLSEKLDTSDLAAGAGVSECHFSRAFRQSVGMPPPPPS